MKCPNDKQEMPPAEVELRDEIGGRSYVATVHGWRCAVCGEEAFEGNDLHRFELAMVRDLGQHAEPSGPVFRRMRRILGFSSSELAELLGVAVETVSRWESGVRSVDGLAFRVLGVIGADRLEGRSTTQDTLREARTPAPSGGEVRITVA
jgi:DNA-binding transcriptional regulator YiaG